MKDTKYKDAWNFLENRLIRGMDIPKEVLGTLYELVEMYSTNNVMKWYAPSYKLPNHSKPIIIDCVEGVGEAFYKGKDVFRFMRYGVDVNADDVYRWAEMPTSAKSI